MTEYHKKGSDGTNIEGISINVINLAFVFVVVLFSFIILYSNHQVQKKHIASMNLQKTLIACNDAANTLKDNSDKLTLCVNTYLETESAEDMNEYYSLIDNRLRELEVQKAEEFQVDCTALRRALDLSNELADYEAHAFALLAYSNGTLESTPVQVREYPLTDEEKSLSKYEIKECAHKLIYGSEYNKYKRKIYAKISEFEDLVLTGTENSLIGITNDISRDLNHLRWVAAIGNLLVVILSLLLYTMVTLVLKGYVYSISKNELIEERGTKELRYLARVFNKYMALLIAKQDELRRMAEVDSLTHVASRRALEDYIVQKLNNDDIYGAFIFLDVDDFKLINDTYGHDAGDELLRQLADVINEVFENKAFVGRFGGDEFVVWLDIDANTGEDYIKAKIAQINAAFIRDNKRQMKITVSAGVALCKGGNKYSEVIKAADNSLYDVKKSEKCGCLVCRVEGDERVLNGEGEK